MLKLAMIGAGGYAFELIKRIWEIPEAIELVGVSSNPSRKSAGRTACQDRGVPIYADVDELLQKVQGKADVIFVPTPFFFKIQHTSSFLDDKCSFAFGPKSV